MAALGWGNLGQTPQRSAPFGWVARHPLLAISERRFLSPRVISLLVKLDPSPRAVADATRTLRELLCIPTIGGRAARMITSGAILDGAQATPPPR